MGTTYSASSRSTEPEEKEDGDDKPGTQDNEEKRKKPAIDISQLPVELTSKYTVLDKLGSGSFGSVYRVRNSLSGVLYAAKYVELKGSSALEVQVQATIDDIHIVKVLDTIQIPSINRMVIVMEYCMGGNLLQWIERNRRHELLNEPLILGMFREICEAVYCCHQKQIIHRDLKPENILLDSKRRIKLADFGVARVLHTKSVATSFCGTPPYMAPELFLSYLSRGSSAQGGSIGYDGKCDVWSIGCILWDMANSSNLFIFQLSNHVGLNVAQAKSESMGATEVHSLIDKDIPASYVLIKKLLKGMLKRDPDKRSSLSDVLQNRELRERLRNPIDTHWSKCTSYRLA